MTKTVDIAKLAEENPKSLMDAFLRGVIPNEPEAAMADPLENLTAIMDQARRTSQVVPVSESITIVPPKFTDAALEMGVRYLPNYTSVKFEPGFAFDIYASMDEAVTLNSAERRIAVITCGIELTIPVGFEAQIRPQSGLSSKGILVLPGTVSSDYRGEVSCVVFNISTRTYRIEPGSRIAQMVISPVLRVLPVEEQIIEQVDLA